MPRRPYWAHASQTYYDSYQLMPESIRHASDYGIDAKPDTLEQSQNMPLSQRLYYSTTPTVPFDQNVFRSVNDRSQISQEQRGTVTKMDQGTLHSFDDQQYPSSLSTQLDPFECLGDVEVGIIISLLPDRDLETLRRVSRLWKRYSEYFNKYSAIRERFSWANETVYQAGGSNFANLQFRRHLYHNENLRKGFATRTLSFKDVISWHLDERSLAWIDTASNLRFFDLRSDTNGPVDSQPGGVICLTRDPFWPLTAKDSIVTESLYQLENRDVVICIRKQTGSPVSARLTNTYPVMRLSRQGDIQWIFAAAARIQRSNFAAGTKYLYSLDSSKKDSRGLTRVCLVKRSLEGGGEIQRTPVFPWNDTLGLPSLWNINVTKDDKWLTLTKKQGICTIIIAAETGRLARRIGDLSLLCPVEFAATQPQHSIWENELGTRIVTELMNCRTGWTCYKSTYDEEGKYFYRVRTTFAYALGTWVLTGLDPERRVAFCIHSQGLGEISVTQVFEEGEAELSVSRPVPIRVRNHQLPLRVTSMKGEFRPKSNLFPEGRLVNFGLQGSTTMHGDYLVRHDWDAKDLVILDFWPIW